MLLALWSAYFKQGQPANVTPSRGGVSPYDQRKYQEYLKQISKIQKKDIITVREIERVNEIAEVVKDTPEPKEYTYKQPDVNVDKIAQQIAEIKIKIAIVLEKVRQQEIKKAQNEEAILVLMMAV